MSWNRPIAAHGQSNDHKHSSFESRLLLLMISILFALAIVFVVTRIPKNKVVEHKPTRCNLIKEVTNAIPHVLTRAISNEKALENEYSEFGWYTNKFGQVLKRTRKPYDGIRHDKELFTCAAEGIIDSVVGTPFGEMLLDDDVPEDFEEDFKSSLTNKIEIRESDTPEEREAKERVIAAKAELKKYWLIGQDVREIMIKEKKELRRLYELKEDLEFQLQDMRDSEASQEEICEFATAAKAILRQQNVELPLNISKDEECIVEGFEKILMEKENPKRQKVSNDESF